jgi:hypothetical protein
VAERGADSTMLSLLARLWLVRRLFGPPPRGRSSTYGWGSPYQYGRRPHRSGRRRSSEGFRLWGPFPTYSRRTRGGGRVSVGGCCLPIPLAMTLGSLVAMRAVTRRSTR